LNDDLLIAQAMNAARPIIEGQPRSVRDEVESELLVVIAECYGDYCRGRVTDEAWTQYVTARCQASAQHTAWWIRRLRCIPVRSAHKREKLGELSDRWYRWVRSGRRGKG